MNQILILATVWIGFALISSILSYCLGIATALSVPVVFKAKWKEATLIGIISFFAPFLGCAALAYFALHWSVNASLLTGIALSTTSVAVVYAVMLEFGLNTTDYGKTVLALGLLFSPFGLKTMIYAHCAITIVR